MRHVWSIASCLLLLLLSSITLCQEVPPPPPLLPQTPPEGAADATAPEAGGGGGEGLIFTGFDMNPNVATPPPNTVVTVATGHAVPIKRASATEVCAYLAETWEATDDSEKNALKHPLGFWSAELLKEDEKKVTSSVVIGKIPNSCFAPSWTKRLVQTSSKVFGEVDRGLAAFGGRVLAIEGCDFDSMAHEFGHILGLGHSGSLRREQGQRTWDEYADLSSVMSLALPARLNDGIAAELRGFNAFQLFQLGVLQQQQILDITRSGVFRIGSLSSNARTGPLAARIIAPNNVVYWVEWRELKNQDRDLDSRCMGQLSNTLLVHRVLTSHSNGMAQLNGGQPQVLDTLLGLRVRVGQSGLCGKSGVRITHVRLGEISIQFGASTDVGTENAVGIPRNAPFQVNFRPPPPPKRAYRILVLLLRFPNSSNSTCSVTSVQAMMGKLTAFYSAATRGQIYVEGVIEEVEVRSAQVSMGPLLQQLRQTVRGNFDVAALLGPTNEDEELQTQVVIEKGGEGKQECDKKETRELRPKPKPKTDGAPAPPGGDGGGAGAGAGAGGVGGDAGGATTSPLRLGGQQNSTTAPSSKSDLWNRLRPNGTTPTTKSDLLERMRQLRAPTSSNSSSTGGSLWERLRRGGNSSTPTTTKQFGGGAAAGVEDGWMVALRNRINSGTPSTSNSSGGGGLLSQLRNQINIGTPSTTNSPSMDGWLTAWRNRLTAAAPTPADVDDTPSSTNIGGGFWNNMGAGAPPRPRVGRPFGAGTPGSSTRPRGPSSNAPGQKKKQQQKPNNKKKKKTQTLTPRPIMRGRPN